MNEKLVIPTLTFEGLKGRKLSGFSVLWLKYPRAFNPAHHCYACLIGTASGRVYRDMRRGYPVSLDESDSQFLYLCGVSWDYATAGFREGRGACMKYYDQNLHVPFRRMAGSVVTGETFNGIRYRIENAEASPMPERAPLEFEGLPFAFRRCRNFIWAAEHLPRLGALETSRAPARGQLGLALTLPKRRSGGDR